MSEPEAEIVMDDHVKQPEDYQAEFNPDAYLEHFYSKKAAENGLKTALFAIPNFLGRIAEPKLESLLDVGSGPTSYVAMCCRHRVQSIYLTDYTKRSRDELNKWLARQSTFDWFPICKSIALVEGIYTQSDIEAIEQQARAVTKAVWFCDVHLPELLHGDNPKEEQSIQNLSGTFQVVTSIFCLESACSDLAQYQKAMQHLTNQLRPNGYFILGSVLEDTEYCFGTERFSILYLTESDIRQAMAQAGLDLENSKSFENDGAFMIMARKLSS